MSIKINTHIHFNGNTEEAFLFYQSVFGGDFIKLVRFKDLAAMGLPFPEKEQDKIMQIALPIGNSSMLMGSDVPEMLGQVNENENRSKVVVTPDSKEEADTIFNGLAKGGTIEFPIGNSPWGSYFGALRDKYGVEWMIDYTANQ